MSVESVKLEWIDKHEAARRLKVSPSRAIGIADEGKIRTRPGRNARNQPITEFLAADVDAKAILCSWATVFDGDAPAGVTPSERLKAPAPPLALPPGKPAETINLSRPWLTLDEAAEYSGLTKRWLREEAESTLDPARNVPTVLEVRDMGKFSPGGRWRFHRETLNKW